MAGTTLDKTSRTKFRLRLYCGLVVKPVRFFCEYCGKYIPSDIEWRCSYCSHENRETRLYSFLNKCRNCKRPPSAFVCPHCDQVHFLDESESDSHPAIALERLPTAESPEETSKRKRLEHSARKEELNAEIEITELNVKLAKLKTGEEFKSAKTAREKLEQSFSEHDAHVMGVHMLAKEQRKNNSERFKDDPEMLERANDSLDAWIESHL